MPQPGAVLSQDGREWINPDGTREYAGGGLNLNLFGQDRSPAALPPGVEGPPQMQRPTEYGREPGYQAGDWMYRGGNYWENRFDGRIILMPPGVQPQGGKGILSPANSIDQWLLEQPGNFNMWWANNAGSRTGPNVPPISMMPPGTRDTMRESQANATARTNLQAAAAGTPSQTRVPTQAEIMAAYRQGLITQDDLTAWQQDQTIPGYFLTGYPSKGIAVEDKTAAPATTPTTAGPAAGGGAGEAAPPKPKNPFPAEIAGWAEEYKQVHGNYPGMAPANTRMPNPRAPWDSIPGSTQSLFPLQMQENRAAMAPWVNQARQTFANMDRTAPEYEAMFAPAGGKETWYAPDAAIGQMAANLAMKAAAEKMVNGDPAFAARKAQNGGQMTDDDWQWLWYNTQGIEPR